MILIRGSADDDTLIVDNSNGLIGAKIIFDADGVGASPLNQEFGFPAPGGFDVLRLIGSTPTTTTYNPGETMDAGAVFQENNQIVQRVEFFGLEPVQVVGTGAGDTLNVAAQALGVGFPQALNAANAINYTEGPNSNDPVDPVFAGDITGLVTIDGFESLEFSAFGTLNIDAGAGSDEINLNNPVTPTDLTAINVNGGDPTAGSDTVIVNGTTGADTIDFAPTTDDDAVITGAGPVAITLTTVESTVIDGQGGADSLTYTSPAGNDIIDFTPVGNGSEGSISAVRSASGILMPVSYTNLFSFAGSLIFADISGTRTDELTVSGTANDDAFSITSAGNVSANDALNNFATPNIATPGVSSLRVAGLDGDDSFSVPGDHPFTSLFIEGGNPDSGSDVLNFTGSGVGAVTLNLTNHTVQEAGFAAVSYSGMETVHIDANSALTVDGTTNNETFNVTPTGTGNDGFFDHSGSTGVAFTYTDATTITFNGGGGNADEVNIFGDAAADMITSTANAITVDGSTVTLGSGFVSLQLFALGGDDNINLDLDLTGTRKVVDAGEGDDSVDLSGTLDATIFGGDGNDTLIGSPLADTIFGGPGNDTLIGGGGNDFQYGEDGNDTFGNPTLTSNGVADDPGDDFNFGGSGFDNFVWEPGDGEDVNNGGDDGADIFRFFGGAAGDTFTLRSGGTPTHFNALFNAIVIDNHGIEDVLVDPLGGDDTVIVNDLFQTEVLNVTVNAGGGNETITVEGRTTDDDVQVTSPAAGTISIEGLTYDVNLTNSATTDNLVINGNVGNDTIDVASGVETSVTSTINGGAGNDTLTGTFNTANGGDGDDLIIGGANDQTINGGAGEDTFVGGAGNDTIDGGTEFDTILIAGTSGADVIDVFQAAPTTLNHTVNGVTEVDTLVASTVEEARIVAGDGADLIRVNWLDALGVNAAVDSLRMTVEGGPDATSDRLVVVDDGTDDLVLYRKGQTNDSGTVQVGPGNAEPLLSVFSGVENIDFVDEAGNAIVNAAAGPQLVVFKHDPFESNDDRFTATYLGSGNTINVDPTIDPGPVTNPFGDGQSLPGDSDFYRVVADSTGTLDLQVYFRQVAALASGRPGLPNDGNLDINVRDSSGNIIAGFGANDATDDERVRIPAVEGQTYYLEVFGNGGTAINVYNISVVNHAPPIPYDIELNDILQVGTVNNAVVPTTTVFRANIAPANPVLPAAAFDYPGKTVEFTSGANIGRTAVITAFSNATGQFTLAAGLIAAPATGDTFLIETTDTGRSQFDDVTRDSTPIITFRLDDDILLNDLPGNPTADTPPDEVIPIPFNAATTAAPTAGAGFRVPVFIEGVPQQPGTAPQTPIGYAQPVAGVSGVYTFDFANAIGGPLTLTDGSHFINAKVEIIDPNAAAVQYGFGGRSASLEIVVDATAPAVYFGDPAIADDGLHPNSDSGDLFLPATLSDNATNDTTPTFFGRAEANAIIRAYVDRTNNGFTVDDLLIGQTVATPLDGTNQHPFGEWEITSTLSMNDPLLTAPLGLDGVRNIYVTAEDPAGNTSAAGLATLQIFIDTQGPQVTDVFITDFPEFNLFTLKPDTPQPTPRVDSLTISLQDLPARAAGFLYAAISNVPPLPPIVLVGDHSGVIAILDIEYNGDPVVAGNPATGDIVLTFTQPGADGVIGTVDDIGGPLPDDRFTLTLGDSIIDPVGNALDGENNAAEPVGNPFFPTGDSIPGGDFIARFTVDSRPEIATWSQGVVYADINGNFVWDPEGQDNDATNRDFVFNFGEITDAYFAGNFSSVATSSGFDKLGAYGRFSGVYQFFLDTNDDGVGDLVPNMFYQVNAVPVAGNFFNSAADNAAVAAGQRPRDEIGAYDGQNWYLDTNGNNQIDFGEKYPTALRGIPVVGDFNGDGFDDLATFNNETGVFQFDLDRNGTVDDTLTFGFSGFGEKPVAGDVNLDGIDDIVMWVPGQEGQLPKDAGEFHFLVSDNPIQDYEYPEGEFPLWNIPAAKPSNVFNPFSPAPLGNDLIAQFGDDFALPLLGNFDPPVASDGGGSSSLGSLTNELNRFDTNVDGRVSALDALVVINAMGRGDYDTSNPLRLVAALGGLHLDASHDGNISALDALQVINELSRQSAAAAGEQLTAVSWAASADNAISDLDDDNDDLLALLAADQEQQRVKS